MAEVESTPNSFIRLGGGDDYLGEHSFSDRVGYSSGLTEEKNPGEPMSGWPA